MTETQILAILQPWQDTMQRAIALLDSLRTTIDPHPEGGLHLAFEVLMHLATRQAAQIIGCSDEWLEDWWLEYDFGARPLEVQFGGSSQWLKAATLPELAAIIHKDMQPT